MDFPKTIPASDFSLWLKEFQLAGYDVREVGHREWVVAESQGWVEEVYERMSIVAVYRCPRLRTYYRDSRAFRGMSRSIFNRLGTSDYSLDYL